MPPVNGVRGEIRVKIGSEEFILVPSYERFAAIQEATGLDVFPVMQRIEDGSMTIIVTVIQVASNSKLEREQIGNLILENEGITALRPLLYLFMSSAARGFERVNKLLAERGADAEEAPSGETKSGSSGAAF